MQVLLIHSDSLTRESLSLEVEGQYEAKIIQAQDIQEGLEQLLDDAEVDLILCEDHSSSLKLFKYLLSVGSEIPVILITEQETHSITAFQDLILGSVTTSEASTQLKLLIDSALQSGRIRLEVSNAEYCRIAVRLLTKIVPLRADIFIRLSSIKYVKILRAGDHFGPADLDKFQRQKQLSYLYVKRADALQLLDRLKSTIDSDLDETVLTPEAATAAAVDIHDAIHEMGNLLGFTDEVHELAKKGMKTALRSIGSSPKLKNILRILAQDKEKYISSHSIALAQISCTLAAAMEWPSESTFQKLTYAAFFHDIIFKNQTLARVKNLTELESKKLMFTPSELAIYEKHPKLVAELVNRFSEVPPDVDTILLNHHERADGTGFPRGEVGSHISPVSCLFILAHDFIDFLYDGGQPENIELFFADAKTTYQSGHFKKILNSLDLSGLSG